MSSSLIKYLNYIMVYIKAAVQKHSGSIAVIYNAYISNRFITSMPLASAIRTV